MGPTTSSILAVARLMEVEDELEVLIKVSILLRESSAEKDDKV